MISVCIPVGPYAVYKKHLAECLESVRSQTVQPAAIILVDDMAGLDPTDYPDCRIWRSPWRIGIPAVANVALALAPSDLALYVSCDDKLMPNCLEMCRNAWEEYKDPLGFYWLDVEYSTGEKQALPCGHAMTHKRLFQHTGGYPPESAVGACDHIFMNWALQHPQDIHLYEVAGGPLYWHREHPEQYTKNQRVSPATIADVREGFNRTWRPIDGAWGRYEP